MRAFRPRAAEGEPEITVVMPCYNYGRYLAAATDAILSQEGVRARVIIVDDASTDDSALIADALAAADERVSVVHHAENLGHIGTYNDGLARVRTEYVSLVSADDLVAPGAFARATALMQRHPRVGLVYGRAPYFTDDEPDRRRRRRHLKFWAVWSGRSWMRARARTGCNVILSPEAVMRTAAMQRIGGYNPRLPHSADLEYWLRSCADGWDVGRVVGSDQAYYRVHGVNMHSTRFGDEVVEFEHRLEAFRFLQGRDGATGSPGGADAWTAARRASARLALRSALRRLDAGGTAADARALMEYAVRVSPEVEHSALCRRVGARVCRAEAGAGRRRTQRVQEWGRRQADRIRFTVLGGLGE